MKVPVRALLLSASLLITGCPVSPVPEVSSATVAGLTPHTDFADTGLLDVTLLARDAEGEAILSSDLEIEVNVTEPVGTGASVEWIGVHAVDANAPLIAAVNMDASGSMESNDPARLRVVAAQQFIDRLDADHAVAVMDFGTRDEPPFENGRLLIDFTTDKDAAKAAAEQVEAFGITPLYESVVEVLDYFDDRYPAGSGNRGLLVLGDGRPNNSSGDGTLEKSCAKSVETGIPINTIGFGPAADRNPVASDEAVGVLRALSFCSGGAYNGAVAPEDLTTMFDIQGEVATKGAVVFTVRFDPVPTTGDVAGRILVGNGAQTPVEIEFVFAAP